MELLRYVYTLDSILNLDETFISRLANAVGVNVEMNPTLNRENIAKAMAKRTREGHKEVILIINNVNTYLYLNEIIDITRPYTTERTKVERILMSKGIPPSENRTELIGQIVNLLQSDPINYPITTSEDVKVVLGIETDIVVIPELSGLPDSFKGDKNSGLEHIFQKVSSENALKEHDLVFLYVPGFIKSFDEMGSSTDTQVQSTLNQVDDIHRRLVDLQENKLVTRQELQEIRNLVSGMEELIENGMLYDPTTSGLFVFIATRIDRDRDMQETTIRGENYNIVMKHNVLHYAGPEFKTTYPETIQLHTGNVKYVKNSNRGIMTCWRYNLERLVTIRSVAFRVATVVNSVYTNRQMIAFDRYFNFDPYS